MVSHAIPAAPPLQALFNNAEPVITPASLIEFAACRYHGESAGMRVLRSTGVLPCQTRARILKFASKEKRVFVESCG